MQLKELIVAVKEKNLSKDQLEAYRDQMSHLFADMQFEMATLEKEEALFMEGESGTHAYVCLISKHLKGENTVGADLPKCTCGYKEKTVASKKVAWKATKSGQRLIVLKRYCLATKELLNSLKSRLYSIY